MNANNSSFFMFVFYSGSKFFMRPFRNRQHNQNQLPRQFLQIPVTSENRQAREVLLRDMQHASLAATSAGIALQQLLQKACSRLAETLVRADGIKSLMRRAKGANRISPRPARA